MGYPADSLDIRPERLRIDHWQTGRNSHVRITDLETGHVAESDGEGYLVTRERAMWILRGLLGDG